MRFLDPRTAAIVSATCGLLLTPFLLSSQVPRQDDGATPEEIAEAGELFRSSCASCHLPPDPDHVTDRAWLNQVTDTA